MSETLFLALDKPPRYPYNFLWADYVELLCLCSKNGFIAKGNLQAQQQEAEDVQDDSEFESDLDEVELGAVADDRTTRLWEDVKKRLLMRSKSFPGWPFKLDGDVLRRQFNESCPNQRLYVSLLIASSLRLCHLKRCQEVTQAFEQISYEWLRQSVTQRWQVRPFGAHQTLPNAYPGKLRAKLEALATDVAGRLLKDASDYDLKNSGDAGIDLVAWQEMGDARGNLAVIFGQCACSPSDWESKQLDVTPAAIEAHIHVNHPGAAYCFVPHDLYRNNTQWDRAAHVKRVVLIDRKRLLHLFNESKTSHELPNWPFVQEATQLAALLAT